MVNGYRISTAEQRYRRKAKTAGCRLRKKVVSLWKKSLIQTNPVSARICYGCNMSRRESDFCLTARFFEAIWRRGEFTGKVITCARGSGALRIKIRRNFFTRGETKIRPDTKYFGVFYPPFSTRIPFKNVKNLAELPQRRLPRICKNSVI